MKKNPFGRRKVASAECELSVDDITITLAIKSRRLGAGMQRLASAGPQLQHERGGAYWQTKASQTSRPSPRKPHTLAEIFTHAHSLDFKNRNSWAGRG